MCDLMNNMGKNKRKRRYSSEEDDNKSSKSYCKRSRENSKSPDREYDRHRDKLSKYSNSSKKSTNRYYKKEEEHGHFKNVSPKREYNKACHSNIQPTFSENSRQSKPVTEKDLLYDWNDYRYELNKIFFNNDGLINRGTDEYHDFWKFVDKYTSLNKGRLVKKVFEEAKFGQQAQTSKKDRKSEKIRSINLKLTLPDSETLRRNIPYDLDRPSDRNRLTVDQIEEFKYILLLYLDFNQKKKFEKLRNLRESQNNLPIAEFRSNITETVNKNNVIIIAGDTGCGKSTQVPQYLLKAGYNNIACTQPRRIACIALSKRVAYETLNEFGSQVGYQIRFEKKKTEHTKIVFLTEGLLLRQITTDTLLEQYNVIILDEIHERHLHTDFLLGVIKCLILKRPDIKVILMSATINLNLFKSYFMNEAPVIQVPGRLYPIKLQYFPIPIIEQCTKNDKINPAPYVRVLTLIDKKYPSNERGDVLIFLSGMSEISTIHDALQAYAEQNHKWIILQLHSTLSVTEQEKVFHTAPPGIRKCILSTNIAETSITIDGIRFVIDSGKVKEMNFDSQTKMQRLKEYCVSQASAEQRKGRAGRTGPGVCFRLYSEEEYASYSPYSSPEIQRVSLDSIILQMISMGLPNIKLFPFIEPPSTDRLDTALESLKSHDALSSREELTTVGKLLSQLPMDVSLGKMLIMGSLFNQIDIVLSLAAAMSVQSPFTNRAFRDPDASDLNKEFQSDHGDPFTLLNSFKEWLAVKIDNRESSRKWCRKRGLEEQRFYEMTKLRSQFAQLLSDSGLNSIAGQKRTGLTGAERAKRNGELKQLRDLKRELQNKGSNNRRQMLKADFHGVGDGNEEENSEMDLKDIDFKISNDPKVLKKLYNSSNIESFKEMILVKIILCCGLYPYVAIADQFNNYKPGADQVFHTKTKPFVVIHPNSVFASNSDVLELTEADIIDLPDFSRRSPCSEKHQLLFYVSLLETNKPYIVNSFRVPAAQMLLLFSKNIDTNADLSKIVCDEFIELKFPDPIAGQNLIFKVVQLRHQWQRLLNLRIEASTPNIKNQDEITIEANSLETRLASNLVELMLHEVLYSIVRLLPADVKLLHSGGMPQNAILSKNPFGETDETCEPNCVKGGVDLTSYLTYDCLLDTTSSVTTISTFDSVCPYCDKDIHFTVLERFHHLSECYNLSDKKREKSTSLNTEGTNKKRYFCEQCNSELVLSIKEIFLHKRKCRESEENT